MKAALTGSYGPPEVVRVAEMPEPAPGPGEVKVRVTAAGVSVGDARMRGNDVPAGYGPILRLVVGLRRPRHPVMGSEFAGRVEALGPGVTGFAVGDRVMGLMGLKGGAHAEALVIRADRLLCHTPDSLSDIEAACFFFGGLTAADFLIDKSKLAAGEKVLVNGATGAVGTAAIQIAKARGAHVTAFCSAANAGFALRLGADAALDYRKDRYHGQWDLVMDVAGTLPWPKAHPLLAPGGRLLPVTATLGQSLGSAVRPRRDGRHITRGQIAETKPAMERLLALHAEGAYRPVVGVTFPFARIAAAHERAGGHHKRGNVVVVMDAYRAA